MSYAEEEEEEEAVFISVVNTNEDPLGIRQHRTSHDGRTITMAIDRRDIRCTEKMRERCPLHKFIRTLNLDKTCTYNKARELLTNNTAIKFYMRVASYVLVNTTRLIE